MTTDAGRRPGGRGSLITSLRGVRFPGPLPLAAALAGLLAVSSLPAADAPGAAAPAQIATSGPESALCLPDSPNSLPEVLDALAARLTGLDALAVADAAASLRARADERAGLCRMLAGLAAQVEVARAEVALREGFLAGCQADRAACWSEWEAGLKRPRATGGRSRLGWTIGACGIWRLLDSDPNGGIGIGPGGCWGWRP